MSEFTERIKRLGGTMQLCKAGRITEPGNVKPALTCGCGKANLARLPYKRHDSRPGVARVCAVCDCAAEFPRVVGA